jgi:hypothetical protein
MSKLRFKISMSLDGFVAGPSQGVDIPLGIGGGRLFEGVGDTLHGLELVRTVATPAVTHLKLARR